MLRPRLGLAGTAARAAASYFSSTERARRWDLGDKLATEGPGEKGGGETLHLGASGGVVGLRCHVGEEGFDTTDDFVLSISEGRRTGNSLILERLRLG